MLEDEIQYLGSRFAPRPNLAPLQHPFLQATEPVTSIVLHIEESGRREGEASTLTFLRSDTQSVTIGRRPGDALCEVSVDLDKALFRCPVVSRRHAKIAFTESGRVCLVDTNSHHGTRILKPGDTISRMLEPEVPTPLADGDIITFGKTVGKERNAVKPVVARVQLRYSDLHIRTPERCRAPFSLTRNPSGGSGRYGVFVPSPPSSHDSDVEEVPPPQPIPKPVQNSEDSSLGRAFEILKRLLPPVHPPSSAIADFGDSPSPDYDRSPSPLYSRSHSSGSCRSISPFDPPSPLYSFLGIEDCVHDAFEDGRYSPHFSRSTSPMDLASPSPPRSVRACSLPQYPSPPPVPQEALVMEVVTSFDSEAALDKTISSCFDEDIPDSASVDVVSPTSKQASPARDLQQEKVADDSHPPVEEPQDLPVNVGDRSEDITKLTSSVNSVLADVAKLQSHRRKYKHRFNSNVHTIAEKLTDLDDRVNDVNESFSAMEDQLESVTDRLVPALRSDLDWLQGQFLDHSRKTEKGVLTEHESVNKSVAALNKLVDEMKSLCQSTEMKMTAELEAVKAARIDALALISSQVQVRQLQSTYSLEQDSDTSQTAIPTSLKRKRLDGEDEHESESVGNGEESLTVIKPAPITTVTRIDGIAVPSPKRARRIAATVLHTATAATIGAIATWSALAFS